MRPSILRELHTHRDYWLVALNAITGEDHAPEGATLPEAWTHGSHGDARKDTYLRVSPNLELEQSFPGLTAGSYKLTSPKAVRYNCVAWAAGDTKNFWDDFRIDGKRVKGYLLA